MAEYMRIRRDIMEPVYWMIAFVVLAVIEGLTLALTTMWFAGGAAAAFLVCLAGGSVNAQLAVFAVKNQMD